MIWNICAGLFLVSTLEEGVKQYTFRKKLEREGLEINDNRSVPETIISFLKDYVYLLVPGYNIFKSSKELFGDEDTYYTNRLITLNKRKIVRNVSETKVEKKALPVKKEKKTVEVKKETSKDKVQETKKTVVKPVTGNSTLEELKQEKAEYYRRDQELRAKYKRLRELNASPETLSELVGKIKAIDAKYNLLCEEIAQVERNERSATKLSRKNKNEQ